MRNTFVRVLSVVLASAGLSLTSLAVSPYYGPFPFSQPKIIHNIELGWYSFENDGSLPDNYNATVSSGKTFTIENGKTITVYGQVIVDGTLINNGTLIVEASETEKDIGTLLNHGTVINNGIIQVVNGTVTNDIQGLFTNEGDFLITTQGPDTNTSALDNIGELINKGTIDTVNGTLLNKPDGFFTNDGTVVIRNTRDNLIGLANTSRTENGKTKFGTVTNNGTIQVRTTAGTGLHNMSDGVFDNQGVIEKTKDAVIKGKISGNPVNTVQ